MATHKYLFIYRSPTDKPAQQPSPAEMQAMFAQWTAWKEQFKDEIVDLGDGLQPGGKVVRTKGTSDGPFMEAKEVVGGYSIVQAVGIERAIEISKACPIMFMPGASIEIREMAGF